MNLRYGGGRQSADNNTPVARVGETTGNLTYSNHSRLTCVYRIDRTKCQVLLGPAYGAMRVAFYCKRLVKSVIFLAKRDRGGSAKP